MFASTPFLTSFSSSLLTLTLSSLSSLCRSSFTVRTYLFLRLLLSCMLLSAADVAFRELGFLRIKKFGSKVNFFLLVSFFVFLLVLLLFSFSFPPSSSFSFLWINSRCFLRFGKMFWLLNEPK